WPNSPSYRDRPAPRPGLTTIVQRAQALTNASGAALALIRKGGEEIECCVRSGRTAPPLGKSPLASDSLAALCISSGQQLWCHDVTADPRMRGAAVFDPAIRALVFTPITKGDHVIGVLAVFAEVIDAFSAKHLLQLESAAAEISDGLGTEGKVAAEPSRSQPPTSRPEALEPDAGRPKPPASARLPLAARESTANTSEAVSSPWKLETDQNMEAVAAHRFTTPDGMAARPRRWPGSKLVPALAGGLLGIGGGITWAFLAAATPSSAGASVEAFTPSAGTEATRSPEAPTVKINPEHVRIRKGNTFILNVTFSRASDIASVSFQINYDPRLMEFVK